MTRPGNELQSPGSLANTLPTRPNSPDPVVLEYLPAEARIWVSSTYLSHIVGFRGVDSTVIS